VIIVASVSCIYGIGDPEEYGKVVINLRRGEIRRDKVLRHLVDIFTSAMTWTAARGRFRVRGDTLEVFPAYSDLAYRIEFWGDEIDRITEIDPLTGEVLAEHQAIAIYPAKHFITPQEKLSLALRDIEAELEERLAELRSQGKLLEAQRLEQRTKYDLEMLREVGYCAGIENYSRHLDPTPARQPTWTLLGLLPPRLPALRRRVPHDHPPASRDVPWRHRPQKGAGGVWLPAAQRPGQPPPALRGV
jgi:excinuclease ABC subunit B